jgi:hypothetical protein
MISSPTSACISVTSSFHPAPALRATGARGPESRGGNLGAMGSPRALSTSGSSRSPTSRQGPRSPGQDRQVPSGDTAKRVPPQRSGPVVFRYFQAEFADHVLDPAVDVAERVRRVIVADKRDHGLGVAHGLLQQLPHGQPAARPVLTAGGRSGRNGSGGGRIPARSRQRVCAEIAVHMCRWARSWVMSSMRIAAAYRSFPARSDKARAAAICSPIRVTSWSAGLR